MQRNVGRNEKVVMGTRISSLTLCLWLGVCGGVEAKIIEVSNTNDAGKGSLRQALMEAQDGDQIQIRKTG